MTTQYVMTAIHINSSPLGRVYWVVTGAADMSGTYSGYNPADLTNIAVDYTTTLPSITANGSPVTIGGNPVVSQSLNASNDGYVLTWDNADGYYKAEKIASGTSGSIDQVGGRLTLSSGNAVPITTVTSSTLYYTPYKHNKISLFNGSSWDILTTNEVSLSLTMTDGYNYDVFAYNNGGTVALELSSAWTDNTTRSSSLGTQDGMYVKNGDATRRYLGTIRAYGTNTTTDGYARRFIWNMYNQQPRYMNTNETAVSWSYTSPSWRISNNNSYNCIEYVVGVPEISLEANSVNIITAPSVFGNIAIGGIGIDSTTVNGASLSSGGAVLSSTNTVQLLSIYNGYPGIGYHKINWLEYGNAGLVFYSQVIDFNYSVTSSSGATYLSGSSDIGNHGDEAMTTVSLPFNVVFYGGTYSSVYVCSNGFVDFTLNSSAYNFTIPNALRGAMINIFQFDEDTSGTGFGVFTATFGSAPNRSFVIEYRNHNYGNAGATANYEVVFYEGQYYFDLIYATSATGTNGCIGIQNANGGRYTVYNNSTTIPSNGTKLRFSLNDTGTRVGLIGKIMG